MAALWVGGAGACSIAADGGDPPAGDRDVPEEAVDSAAQAFTLASPELAAVLAAFHTLEIMEAQIALTRATDQYVREFAQTMLDHHTAASQLLGATLAQLGMTPLDNPISLALIEQAAQDKLRLEGLTGDDFDWTYINLQIQLHREFLGEIQEQLAVVGPELQPGISHLVPDIRSTASQHLAFATSLLSLVDTRYVPESRHPSGYFSPGYLPGAPYSPPGSSYYGYGGTAPYSPYGSPYYGYYGRGTPYSPAPYPYSPYPGYPGYRP
ncbi:DUF4142 domain-containing protein [Sorangium cellulosum]|uniref:DUF4142 domain-containing protein n=1 Tax=Sorangium cellulosum TaxID=56 RepID=UPI001F2E0DD9|nr:DUF4142 domain-containing protein [Sorangium cellulosum]